MLLAQGLGEYGALAGGGGFSGLADFLDNVGDTIRDAGPTGWMMMFFGVVVVWFVFFRRG
jgi:hypothetical protein